MGEVVNLPEPRLSPEQRQHWHEQAAYWGVQEEASKRALDYAQKQRGHALRMLGMLASQSGLEV